jgi:hypothetical protein
MPRYEYICNCDEDQKTYTVRLSFSEYKPEIPCPCGNGFAVRKFSDVSVLHGLSANEKKFGSNKNRKDKQSKQILNTLITFCCFLLLHYYTRQ